MIGMQPLIDEYYCDVPGYEDYYQISNFGNVRSVDRRVVGRNGLLKSKIIQGSISNGSVLNKNVGDSNGTAILTAEQVKEIKLLLGIAKMKLQEIGDLFGVSNHVIHKIKRGKNWAWLDEKGLFTSCNH